MFRNRFCWLIVLAAAIRLGNHYWVSQDAPIAPPTNASNRTVLYEQFDPDAAVVVVAGEDGAAGIVGVDDDGNGLIDDRGDLGATRSDDQCLVVSPGQLDELDQSSRLFAVLQKGAYVPVSRKHIDQSTQPARAIVVVPSPGSSDGKVIQSFVVDL